MAKERLSKTRIAEKLNDNDYEEFLVVLKKEFKKTGSTLLMSFKPDILGKIKIDGYVRYINMDTKLENQFSNKIESFKSLKAAQNFIEKNKQIFEFVLNDNSKVRLETLKKIVDIKIKLLKEKEQKNKEEE